MIERINIADLEKELGAPIPAQELALIPESHRTLAGELRTNNNRLQWVVRHLVVVHNTLVEHDKLLSPVRLLSKVVLALIASSGLLLVLVEVAKWLAKHP